MWDRRVVEEQQLVQGVTVGVKEGGGQIGGAELGWGCVGGRGGFARQAG